MHRLVSAPRNARFCTELCRNGSGQWTTTRQTSNWQRYWNDCVIFRPAGCIEAFISNLKHLRTQLFYAKFSSYALKQCTAWHEFVITLWFLMTIFAARHHRSIRGFTIVLRLSCRTTGTSATVCLRNWLVTMLLSPQVRILREINFLQCWFLQSLFWRLYVKCRSGNPYAWLIVHYNVKT